LKRIDENNGKHENVPVRAVVDTDVIISGLAFPRGYPYQLLQQRKSRKFQIVTSPFQLGELERVLSRPKVARYVPDELADDFLAEVMNSAEIVVFGSIAPLVLDPNDDAILATALEARADILVSGDKDLLVLATDRSIETSITSVVDSLNLLRD
jgi:putative PIN family toxin of toxin-antitoxin system